MRPFAKHNFALLVAALLLTNALFAGQAWSVSDLRQTPVVRAVRNVNPAVVNISSEYEITQRTNPFFDHGLDPLFDSFFRDFFDPGYQHKYHGTSLGSGVIVDGKQGYILTNEHVIAKSSKIKVVLQNELEFQAELVGTAPDFDLAVLQIKADAPLPDIEMGDSDDILIGETVIAIGNPFGFSHTVTTGVVSALHRAVQTEDRTYRDFIQTDASINPGNSGGPLLNITGDLIGITTAIYSKAQGIGFAIPINKAKRVMKDLIKYGEVHSPWVGLVIQDLDSRLTRYFNTPQGQGILVSSVFDDSPAGKAGLQSGAVIIAIGKKRVVSAEAYYEIIRDFAPGDDIPLAVWENGRQQVLIVHSTEFPNPLAEQWAYVFLGVKVKDIAAAARLRFKIAASQGVIVTSLRPGSYLESVGVSAGDVIRKVNEMIVANVNDFKRAVVKYRHKDPAVLVIQRGSQQYYVTVKLGA